MIRQPFFSVVMACYQVEAYLDEAVGSLVSQSLPFRDYVQLILVDDGSRDRTGELADAWQQKYPDNVVAIHQCNGGAAAARNAGLSRASGRYVNFLDADDRLSAETLENVFHFIRTCEDAGEDTEVYTIPLFFFEARQGPHVLNYRFEKGNRIIDLEKEIDAAHLYTSASFIRRDAIGDRRFDTRLQISEDARFLLPLLMQKRKLGVISSAKYMYRRRKGENTSAIQGSTLKKSWYLDTPRALYLEMTDEMRREYGSIPRYIQFTLMYDMQWRFNMRQLPPQVLTADEQELYRSLLMQALQRIDPDIILMQRHITPMHKRYLLEIRLRGESEERRAHFRQQYWQACGQSPSYLHIEFISASDGCVEIEGAYFQPIVEQKDDVCLILTLDGRKTYEPLPVRRDKVDYSIDQPYAELIGFLFRIPTGDFPGSGGKLAFEMTRNGRREELALSFRTFAPLNSAFQQMYTRAGGVMLRPAPDGFLWEKSTLPRIVRQELRLYRDFLHLGWKAGIRPILMRLTAHALRLVHPRPIWLISDRPESAGDNGEALFAYIRKHFRKVSAWFVLSPSSEDYARLRRIGPVAAYRGYLHKLLTLACDCQLISAGTRDSENPFFKGNAPYSDMMARQKYVFLQHGVLRYDLSSWGNRYVKNFCAFITSSPIEKKSVVDGDYFYREDQVWDTGLARYDLLYHDERRIVTVMPTWRKYLVDSPDAFEGSHFFKAWIAVLQDPRLHAALEKHGYTLQLVMHPNMRAFAHCFSPLDKVTIADPKMAYRDIVAQSDLLITDFSSIIFDFAYLEKPVLSYQFDYEDYFSGSHTMTPGSFDEEQDGIGEVCTDHDALIDAVLRLLDRGCRLDDKYAQRIERFFSHHDQSNCRRIVQKTWQAVQGRR